MTQSATKSGLAMRYRRQRGFSVVEAMVSVVILAICLMGIGYALHVSSQMNIQSVQLLHRSGDGQGEKGLRDSFNALQASVYGTLK